MITQTSSSASSPLAKIQSIVFLGLGCNSTTLIGCVAVWIALSKLGCMSDNFVSSALLVLSFAPIFMADAISLYTLGRIRLERENDWDDVLITDKARETTARLYKFYRVLSIIPAYLFAACFVASKAKNPELANALAVAFSLFFVLNFIRAASFIQLAIAPIKESFGGKSLALRSIIILSVFGMLIWQLNKTSRYSNMFIFSSGMIYFVISAMLHPLPSHFSLLPKNKTIRRIYNPNNTYEIIVQGNETTVAESLNPQAQQEEPIAAEDAQIVEETDG